MLYRSIKKYLYQVLKQEEFPTEIKPKRDIAHRFFILYKTGKLVVIKGYCWDGPSGPIKFIARLLPEFLRKRFLKTIITPSLPHDVLYQMMRLGLINISNRYYADTLLRDMCRDRGMGRFRAWRVFKGVRIGAGKFAQPTDKKEIVYEAA